LRLIEIEGFGPHSEPPASDSPRPVPSPP
jgi:hypothetical protein